jgi:hypothetical protein
MLGYESIAGVHPGGSTVMQYNGHNWHNCVGCTRLKTIGGCCCEPATSVVLFLHTYCIVTVTCLLHDNT